MLGNRKVQERQLEEPLSLDAGSQRAFADRQVKLLDHVRWPLQHWYNDEDFCRAYNTAIKLQAEVKRLKVSASGLAEDAFREGLQEGRVDLTDTPDHNDGLWNCSNAKAALDSMEPEWGYSVAWDDVVDACGGGDWNETPLELVLALVDERDTLRDAASAVLDAWEESSIDSGCHGGLFTLEGALDNLRIAAKFLPGPTDDPGGEADQAYETEGD